MNIKEYLTHYRDVVDKEVEGWFYPIDIVMIYGLLKEILVNGDICEIGVAYGKSAICFSQFKEKQDNLYLYDIFTKEIENKARDNITKFGDNSNLVFRIQNTMDLRTEDLQFERPLKLLHIDGCHEHSAVLNDLIVFSPHLRFDGVIILDDYNDYEYPGVNSAAAEFILSKYNRDNWRIYAIGDNKAYMCKKENLMYHQMNMIGFFHKAQREYNVPFPLPMGVREMHDGNVLMCDSRNGIEGEQALIHKLTTKPDIN